MHVKFIVHAPVQEDAHRAMNGGGQSQCPVRVIGIAREDADVIQRQQDSEDDDPQDDLGVGLFVIRNEVSLDRSVSYE